MQTLSLVLKKKWYDMIASGEKTEEYREIKPYWITRLLYEHSIYIPDKEYKIGRLRAKFFTSSVDVLKYQLECQDVRFRGFCNVTFHLGYAKNRPSMTFAIKEIVIDEGKEEWGAFPGKTYFVVRLGKKLS